MVSVAIRDHRWILCAYILFVSHCYFHNIATFMSTDRDYIDIAEFWPIFCEEAEKFFFEAVLFSFAQIVLSLWVTGSFCSFFEYHICLCGLVCVCECVSLCLPLHTLDTWLKVGDCHSFVDQCLPSQSKNFTWLISNCVLPMLKKKRII